MTKKNKEYTPPKLTVKQFETLLRVLDGVTPAKAYKEVYKCAQSTANTNSCRLMAREDIQEFLRIERDKILEIKREEARVRIVREFEKLGYSDISELLEYDEHGVKFFDSKTVDTSAVRSVKCIKKINHKKNGHSEETIDMQLTLHDKRQSLESLARMFGLIIDKHELSGKDGEPIKIIVPEVTKKW